MRDKHSAATVFGHLEDTLVVLDHTEVRWCRAFNQYIDRKCIECLFAVVSRIGDGMVWYLTMLMLPLVWGVSVSGRVKNVAGRWCRSFCLPPT